MGMVDMAGSLGFPFSKSRWNPEDDVYWICLLSIDREEGTHALLYVERTMSHWRFDFLFLRTFIQWLRRTW